VSTSVRASPFRDPVTALADVLEPGQQIVIGQGYGAPQRLIDALGTHPERLRGSTVFVGMLLGGFPSLPGAEIDTFYPSGPFGRAEALGRGGARYVRRSLYEVAQAYRDGSIGVDVVFAQATPARDGRHSLGVTVDYVGPAADRAGAVVLETGPSVPWTGPASSIVAEPGRVLEVACGAQARTVERIPTAADERLADHVAAWIPDGATVQVGMAGWVSPLADRLASRTGLRLHTGLLGDWVMRLMASGALDPSARIVATAAGGSEALYRWLDGHSRVQLAPADVTHDPATLRGLPRFHAVNSVLEVDLHGHLNAEFGFDNRRGGIAGLRDYASAAAEAVDGLSIIALSAASRHGSRIVVRLTPERCSLDAEAADVIVTEHGSADLRGRAPHERAAAILEITAPEHREQLRRGAEQLGLLRGEGGTQCS
jgi:acyl-CoA hydrolase